MGSDSLKRASLQPYRHDRAGLEIFQAATFHNAATKRPSAGRIEA
jgi:hypothetical protein